MAIKIVFKPSQPPADPVLKALISAVAAQPEKPVPWPFPSGPKPVVAPTPQPIESAPAAPVEPAVALSADITPINPAEPDNEPSLMSMASTPASSDSAPWESPHPNYGIFEALADFTEGKYGKKRLLLVKKTGLDSWRVVGWDVEGRRASLEHVHSGIKIKPVLSPREAANYTPFWE